MENSNQDPESLLRLAGIEVQDVYVKEFAQSVVEFYRILLAMKIEEEFAKQLTIAFVRRGY